MPSTIFGPFSERDANRIEKVLIARQLEHKKEASGAAAASFLDSSEGQEIKAHPGFEGSFEFWTFNIPEESLKALGSDLEPYGIIWPGSQAGHELTTEEYHCPSCGYVSIRQDRQCPEHREPLITFSEHARRMREKNEPGPTLIFWVLVLAAGVYLYIAYL
jgi:hypothetical protein